MTKSALLILMLALNACTSTPDTRPYALTQSEQLMRQGITAYQQDHYAQASKSFNNAIILYQSIDDQHGVLLAQINLIKSTLAISQFTQAEQVFSTLNDKAATPALRAQITALRAHHLFLQQKYLAALHTFAPLLKQLSDRYAPVNNTQIKRLLMQTKYALFAQATDASAWFERLSAVIPGNTQVSNAQLALFHRLAAHNALQAGQHTQALTLMQGALTSYKAAVNRRAIAACLQELANIHIAMHDIPAAKQALGRALFIRKWLQDGYKTQQLSQQLAAL
jgi:tetratricopeptide (TPR) repeat protein